ncbi:MAG: 7-cyano-7-deazaguanine synthase [Promethearchaeota archaeon]
MGEIAERAIKKTVASLAFRAAYPEATEASPNLDEHEMRRILCDFTATRGESELLQLFLGHYFFEICIDELRRPASDPGSDLSFGYHFSKSGHIVSLAAERTLRQTLVNQCEASATSFLPFLLKSIKARSSARIEQWIGNGFATVFGAQLSESGKDRKRQDSDKPFVNVIVGTRSLARIRESYTVDEGAKRLLLHTDRSNVSFSFDPLEHWLEHPLHSLVKDLLDIGVVVYMSDLYTKREHDLGRRLGVFMPVRHPTLWSGAHRNLERAVASLGRDDFTIHFVKRKERRDHVDFSSRSDEQCVCLFSGGLDSLAGAVWALDNGLTPVLVSHYASGQIASLQKSLVAELEKIYDRELRHIPVFVAKSRSRKARYVLSGLPRSVMAQHLRSFLFLSLAAATALESGIGDIFVFENGPIALNPLFSEARINTRTTHPHFLAYFRALIKAVFGVELNIENPFTYLTKGQVVSVLARPELDRLAARTNSCWNWFKVPVMAKQLHIEWRQERHDGNCLPCILRRTALHRAGLWGKDARYLTNIFKEYPDLSRDTITAIADFLRFCQSVTSFSDTEILLRAPDLSIYEEGIDSRKLVEMYREHAQEVIRCFRVRANDQLQEDFATILELG